MVVTAASDPIRPDELRALFAHAVDARAAERVALGVSGGSDSTALMVLFADWLRQCGADLATHTVLSVDHRLRPESAAEAGQVAGLATVLGFRHATLVWEGPKPHTGLQAAAREARYRLMGEYARAHGLARLLVAHTLDDQAETLLMRLARGSGVDGLAAMAPCAHLGSLEIARPLLDVPKARLRATLEARGVPWIEDPSNQSLGFERTRLRAARGALDTLGLTGEMLGTSARRLQRARAAIEAVVEGYCAGPEGIVHTDRCGFFRIERERLSRAPEEIALRVLGRCILAAGGLGEPVPLGKLEPIVDSLRRCDRDGPASWTLARALIAATPAAVQIEREPGRLPLPRLTLAGGARALWDGRFAIAVAEGLEGSVEVRALGAEGLAELRRLGRPLEGTRAAGLAASFWRQGALLAVPPLDFWVAADLEGRLSATFVGLHYNTCMPGRRRPGEPGVP